jgi:hypothetical protein
VGRVREGRVGRVRGEGGEVGWEMGRVGERVGGTLPGPSPDPPRGRLVAGSWPVGVGRECRGGP